MYARNKVFYFFFLFYFLLTINSVLGFNGTAYNVRLNNVSSNVTIPYTDFKRYLSSNNNPGSGEITRYSLYRNDFISNVGCFEQTNTLLSTSVSDNGNCSFTQNYIGIDEYSANLISGGTGVVLDFTLNSTYLLVNRSFRIYFNTVEVNLDVDVRLLIGNTLVENLRYITSSATTNTSVEQNFTANATFNRIQVYFFPGSGAFNDDGIISSFNFTGLMDIGSNQLPEINVSTDKTLIEILANESVFGGNFTANFTISDPENDKVYFSIANYDTVTGLTSVEYNKKSCILGSSICFGNDINDKLKEYTFYLSNQTDSYCQILYYNLDQSFNYLPNYTYFGFEEHKNLNGITRNMLSLSNDTCRYPNSKDFIIRLPNVVQNIEYRTAIYEFQEANELFYLSFLDPRLNVLSKFTINRSNASNNVSIAINDVYQGSIGNESKFEISAQLNKITFSKGSTVLGKFNTSENNESYINYVQITITNKTDIDQDGFSYYGLRRQPNFTTSFDSPVNVSHTITVYSPGVYTFSFYATDDIHKLLGQWTEESITIKAVLVNQKTDTTIGGDNLLITPLKLLFGNLIISFGIQKAFYSVVWVAWFLVFIAFFMLLRNFTFTFFIVNLGFIVMGLIGLTSLGQLILVTFLLLLSLASFVLQMITGSGGSPQ